MAARQGTDYWQGQVEGWRQSGLSQIAYCEQHGLNIKSFRRWRTKLQRAASMAPSLTLGDKGPCSNCPYGWFMNGQHETLDHAETLPGIDLTSITLSGQDILLASTGNVRIVSAYDQHLEDRYNTARTQVNSQSSQLTRASRIEGDSIRVAGAHVVIDAADLLASGSLHLAAAGDLSLGANTDLRDDYSLSIQSKSSFLSKKTRTDETRLQSALTRPTSLSGAEVQLSAGGDLSLYASQITATEAAATLVAGGDLAAYAVYDQEQRLERHERKNSFLGITYHLRASEDQQFARVKRGQCRHVF